MEKVSPWSIIFFLAFGVAMTLYLGKKTELESCRYWSQKVYEKLSPAAKKQLDSEWEYKKSEDEYLHELEDDRY